MIPGFEFDSRAQHAGLLGSDPFSPDPLGAAQVNGAAADRPGAEWTNLLRPLPARPARRNWSREFLAGLHFRGWVVRVAVPVLAMIVIGVAVVVLSGANGGSSGSAPPATSLGFPPATLAGGEFTAAASGRGIDQSMGRVASDGAEIVAVGSQAGARIARAQFFVSLNDGRSWAMGSVRTPGGAEPPPGRAARFVAGGQGQWVAVGPGSIWTSIDGRTWTLQPSGGMPLRAGDQISVLKRTAAGFIAAGANVPGGDRAKSSPVIFLSANGISWRRLDARQLGLAAGTGRVLDLKYAAAEGNQILIAGDISTTSTVGPGKSKRTATTVTTVTTVTGGAWLSSDNGSSWSPATLSTTPPAGHGAQPQISGLAPVDGGFVLLRPATVSARPAVDVYRSANGTAWTFEATLSAPAGLVTGMVNGGPDGAAVTAQGGGSGRMLTAFVSANGVSWQQTQAFGRASEEEVSGVARTQGGAVVTGTTAGTDSRQPAIAMVAGHARTVEVDIATIAGAFDPQLAVNDVAADGGTQVAVGSANGFPAAWVSADGGSSWTRATGATQPVFGRPGTQQLTSVTHGTAGWLAVGGVGGGVVVGGAARHPVVVSSADGSSWQAVDGEAAFGAPGLVTEAAAAGPDGYVIVGDQDISNRMIAAAWWSATGPAGWQRAGDGAPGALDGPGASRQMLAVTASSTGFVAVGSDGNQASAWTSPDGRSWRQADLPVPIGSVRAVLQHVASRGRTVAAVGTAVTIAGQRLPFAASSSDGGVTWTESPLPVPAGLASVTALAEAGGEFTAAGTFGPTPGHQDVVLWTSVSGATWKAVMPSGQGLTGPGIQAMTALTAAGSTLTGVGYTASPASEQPVFWQSPIR